MTRDLRVERVLDAAPEAVFDAFTDPDAQWEMYADAPDWVVRSECDLRVGGRWTIEFGPPGGGRRGKRACSKRSSVRGAWCTGRRWRCQTDPASSPGRILRSRRRLLARLG